MESYKIKNLTFKYPTAEDYALRSITLDIEQGEFVTLCGPSGCGKSTLLRILKPSLAPNGEKDGEILFWGNNLSALDLREQTEKIGFVMQSPENQIVTDKVWHELAFGLESLGMENSEIRARVAEMAAFFGIEDWYHRKTTDLSGGQKQLLNLASVMVMQPSVLILDEPTSQLDPIASQELLEAVAKINRELGVTVILSEHRLEESLSFTDRMVVMENGEIVYCGKPAAASNVLKTQQSSMLDAMPTAMRVFAALEENGENPVTVREGRAFLQNYKTNHTLKNVVQREINVNSDVILELNDVYFRYDKDSPDVIKSLSFKVEKGELYAILGGNGSGKTTALSLISKVNKPYRGEIRIMDDTMLTGLLPQNPQTLFVGKTVEKDIWEMLSDSKLSKAEKQHLFDETVKLCELEALLDRHPYDLSGGEMQRAALAKVLLRRPDLLLLDEPTKGMDAHFKNKLANILKSLQKEGVTIIMVSHDVEFCARFADRCAMFFDGGIVSENKPSAFFAGKSFYTTAANRMARGIIANAVTTEDIITACGTLAKENESEPLHSEVYKKPEINPQIKRGGIKIARLAVGIIFAVIGILLIMKFGGQFTDWRMYAVDLGILLSFAVALSLIFPQKKLDGEINVQPIRGRCKPGKSLLFSIFTVVFIMPLTVLAGIYCFDDKKYYFISLLLIIETMIPFAFSFEKRKPSAREIVVISVLCAIGVAGRIAFFMLPQFKPLSAIVIITGICFGAEAGFLTGAVSAFVSNFYFSQGPWTPWQMFAFAAVGFFGGMLFSKGLLRKTRGALCVFGIIAVALIYGPIADLSALSYVGTPTWKYILTTWAMGLPFNIIHGASTAFFLYTCAPAMIEKLERIKRKYAILE